MVRYWFVILFWALVMLGAFWLTSCASPRGTFCDIAKPHRFSDAAIDAMSDAEVQQELTFNKQGAALCGWKQ